jgi:hypothetical protein
VGESPWILSENRVISRYLSYEYIQSVVAGIGTGDIVSSRSIAVVPSSDIRPLQSLGCRHE